MPCKTRFEHVFSREILFKPEVNEVKHCHCNICNPETYSEPCQTSKMKQFPKIVNG